MKPSKVFSSLFFVLGTAVLFVSIVGCLVFRNAEPKGRSVPREAEEAAESFVAVLSAGDLERASGLIYGQPTLGAEASFESRAAARVWEGFQSSLSCEAGAYHWEGNDLYRDVTLSYLDVSGVLTDIQSIAKAGTEETRDADDLLLEAVEAALSWGNQVTVQGRIGLKEDGGNWYVIPDKTVLSAISGGWK